MTLAHLGKAALVMLALAVSTTGVVALERRHAAVAQAPRSDPPGANPAGGVAVTEVKPGKLNVVVDERGSLEPTHATDLTSAVVGQHRIVSVLPEGSRVTTGQVVCELDPGNLKDQLADQKIVATNAGAAHVRAKLAREIAEIAVTEYVQGGFRKDLQSALGDLKLVEKSIARAEDRLKRTRAARESLEKLLAGQGGPKTSTDLVAELDLGDRIAAAEQTLDRDRLGLELAQSKRELLQKYTKAMRTKQLQAEVEVARSDELAKQQVWDRELGKQKRLERQIDDCKFVAPHDGLLVYHDERRIPGGGAGFSVEVGASVRERQTILTVVDLHAPLRVNTKVQEAWVDRVEPGMTALVTIDMFPDEVVLGTVKSVAPRPDKPRNLDGNIKVYTTLVALAESIPRLRPGMTARATITVASRDKVLSVPLSSLVQYDGAYHVAVKRPDGHVDWREVELGISNDKVVEVKEGLKAGDRVVVEPAPLLSDEQKRKVAEPTPRAARRGRAAGKRAVRP
jgi:RND family efflux transporter MFP subunit